MATIVDRAAVTAALVAQWKAIASLARTLTDDQWSAPSVLPGWTNADVVAHIVGTENMLAGRDVPAAADLADRPHVHNPIGELNEKWIEHFRGYERGGVLAALEEIIEVRTAALASMTQDDFDADAMTPAGADTYGRFMRIRIFDCWMHEVDLRDSIGAGGPADPVTAGWAVDEIVACLPFVVGKRAGAPERSRVSFTITGLTPPANIDDVRTVNIEVTDRAREVEEFGDRGDGVPRVDTSITLDTPTLARLVGGRATEVQAYAYTSGDEGLARSILGAMNYVI